MNLGSLDYWPILIAAVAGFGFGAVWYTTLSRQWIAARGMSAADMEKAKAWLAKGAQPSDTVKRLFKQAGVLPVVK